MIRRRLVWLVAGLLAGCAAPEETPPAPEPAPPSPFARIETAPEPEAEAAAERELCPALAGLVEHERAGYAPFRGASLARERWRARETLPGTERCTIEGEAWPRARFECASFDVNGRAMAQSRFDALVDEIDRCLASAIWFPRDWRKGAPFQFAMGERVQAWLDRSTSPPTAVVLKVQRDIESRDYRLKLNLETVR